jgi:hypothetical protein
MEYEMIKQYFIMLVLFIPTVIGYSQPIPSDSLYLGQIHPGDVPKVFAPGIVSLPNREEKDISFSPDGKEIFFVGYPYPNCRMMHIEFKNGKWTNPEIVSFSKDKLCDEPFFSSDGKRIYLYTTINGVDDLCYSEKNDTLWGNPVDLGSPLNLSQGQYHPCIVADSSIYFASSDGKVCRSQYLNGHYQNRVVLPYPINYADIGSNWEDPYVSPDESFLLIHSTRSGGFGGADIYISYKKADGSWTNPKNLGEKINNAGDDVDADITSDGKYMTYSRNGDLYWVSASFIDSLKHTNFIPYVHSTITNKIDTLNRIFSYTFPDSTFIDDDGNNTLTYSATLSDGTPLPGWLSFNSATHKFSGNPAVAGTYNVKLTATDNAKASASAIFKILVIEFTGIEEKINQGPKEFKLMQNYPNPFNPTTVINYQLTSFGNVKVKIYNTLGQMIKKLVDSFQNAGEHSVVWNATDDSNNPVSSGIYFYRLEINNGCYQKKMIYEK